MVDCETREALIEQQPHRARGMGKTVSSTKAAAKASACRISSYSRSLSGIDFVVREINKLRTEVRLQVIDSSSKICSLRHPPSSEYQAKAEDQNAAATA